MPENNESRYKVLQNVIFVYSSVTHEQKQLNQDNKPPMTDNPLEFHSWEVKALVTESVFRKWKKEFRVGGTSKGAVAKNFPNAKDVTAADAAEQFGIDEPDEDMILVKFAQACLTGNKKTRKDARPIKLIGIKKSATDNGIAYFDNAGKVITPTTSIGNGSKGHLKVAPVETAHGLYLYPAAVCITDLVEYVGGGGDVDDDGFGVEDYEVDEEFNSDEGGSNFDLPTDENGDDQF